MKRFLIVIPLLILVLSACAEAINTPPIDRKTPMYESVQDYNSRTKAEQDAIDIVVNQYGFARSSIILLKTADKTWTDTCLELPMESEVCVPENLPGFLMFLYADGYIFEAHVDSLSQDIRVINYLSKYASPIEISILFLARQLEIPANNVVVLFSEQIDWPDTCLGINTDESICVPILTPGYRIQLDASGVLYEFHSDIYGSRLLPAQ
ncbi:MAG: hypothetical protein Q7U53_11680 [Anaerolineaceae bacterium]|nr:hypothetical protein [Anaerolineaceae bacterium]